MTTRRGIRGTRGFTLLELIVSLVLAGVLGTAVIKLLLTTSRFYGKDSATRSARAVARSPLSLMESDLLGVESSGGIVVADSFTITVRSMYAPGVLCGAVGSTAAISLLPGDSLASASAGYSGYAYRSGGWTYVSSATAPVNGSVALCSFAGVTTLTGGRVVYVTPAPPASTPSGTPVMLYQRVTYRFAPSTALPGRRALWRDVAAGAVSEELAAPFDDSARFRFFSGAGDTSRVTSGTPLSNLRGIELVLDGSSERPPYSAGTLETSGLTTAIFFRKRADR